MEYQILDRLPVNESTRRQIQYGAEGSEIRMDLDNVIKMISYKKIIGFRVLDEGVLLDFGLILI